MRFSDWLTENARSNMIYSEGILKQVGRWQRSPWLLWLLKGKRWRRLVWLEGRRIHELYWEYATDVEMCADVLLEG